MGINHLCPQTVILNCCLVWLNESDLLQRRHGSKESHRVVCEWFKNFIMLVKTERITIQYIENCAYRRKTTTPYGLCLAGIPGR